MRERIYLAIQQELRLHPGATLQDIYKFFFQGAFGPGHLIKDRESAGKYLQKELASAVQFDSILWQPVGYRERFYRLNLQLVSDGSIPAEEFLDAFLESANQVNPPSLNDWRREWKRIVSMIEEMNLALPGFAEDKQRLEEMLASGKVAVHHSQAYRDLYHPHYRIVAKEYFEKLRKTYLDKNGETNEL